VFTRIAIIVLAAFAVHAEPPSGYKLVWSDEFDGSALDTNKWFHRTGARLLSFQKPENVSVADGLLRLALKKEDAGNLHYTAGGVISKQEFTYVVLDDEIQHAANAGD
jgi:beta-glucanase (GH16 family)